MMPAHAARSQVKPAQRAIPILFLLALMSQRSVAGGAGATVPPAAGPRFVLQSQAEIPEELHAAVDVRWAGDRSIYLALGGGGVAEAPLVAGHGEIKHLIPRHAGGLAPIFRVAASGSYLVAAPTVFAVAWRRLNDETLIEEAFEYVQGVDVRDRQLAILGVRADEKRNFATDGAIGWIGSLDKRLADLRAIAFASTGRGAKAMLNCGSYGLGAVRYLPDGSLLMIPGVQPGAELFDAGGKPVRAWDTGALGIDTDCGSLTPTQEARLAAHYDERLTWLNRRRTVDSILPLPEGAGVLIRTVDGSATQWQLKILHSDGAWSTVEVPLQGASAFAHLRGDARGDQLVLLLYEQGWGIRKVAKSRLITATLGR
jgi:hypothetical protein